MVIVYFRNEDVRGPALCKQERGSGRVLQYTRHSWLDQVREKCPDVKFIAHYAILGQYDFLDIYEAPDNETAAKVSMISQANGALNAQSLTAIPYKQFLDLTKEI